MDRTARAFLCVVGLTFACSIAGAQERYAGAGGGRAYVDAGVFDFRSQFSQVIEEANRFAEINVARTVDDSDSAGRIAFGHSINENIAFEVGYADMGEAANRLALDVEEGAAVGSGYTRIYETHELRSFHFAAVGTIEVSGPFSLNGRLGVNAWDIDSVFSLTDTTGWFDDVSGTKSDDGNDLFYGVGLKVGWMGVFYDRYDFGGNDVDFAGFAVTVTF